MIRCFSLSDLDGVLEIEKRSFPKSPYNRATFISLFQLYPDTFRVYVEEAPDEKKGTLCGYIVFSRDGHIISLAVHPLFRRRGIGKMLFQEATQYPHIRRLRAEVRQSNHGARTFYQEMGFETVGLIPNYYGNEDALVIQWSRTSDRHP